MARQIAISPLVKTAFYGADANWGRILAAAGRAGVRFDPAQAVLAIGGVTILERGLPLGPEPEAFGHRHRSRGVAGEQPAVCSLQLGDGRGLEPPGRQAGLGREQEGADGRLERAQQRPGRSRGAGQRHAQQGARQEPQETGRRPRGHSLPAVQLSGPI
ncbi:MAG TPA: bifunctional ornithine acetyltransferase/N-acetylglutamate synthase [Thermoanaerobaculia bacterium]|nr:bifunctional ornithine acetyltransferase/N-acetylglutamate synthase [Thermoanaerobaculia bacterium]